MAKLLNPKRRPEGYVAPTSPEDLVQRYARGERYFVGTRIGLVTKHGPNVHGDLSGTSLAGANFSDSSFTWTNFSESNLEACDFQGASFGRTRTREYYDDFLCCQLRNANLRRAKLDRSDLSGADLQGANLEDASLRNANLILADLTRANLRRAKFQYAALRRAIFDGAETEGADFQGCIPPIPRRPSAGLADLAETSCFLTYAFFHRDLSLDWLKPYLLLFDRLVFDSRPTVEEMNGLTWKDPETWRKIKEQAVFLEDFEGYPDRWALRDGAQEALRPLLVTKRLEYNRRFIKAFARRMHMRGGGFSDRSGQFDLIEDWGQLSPDVLTLAIIVDELLDMYEACRVLGEFGIPAGVDALGSWLGKRVLKTAFEPAGRVQSFQAIVVRDVPDFEQLSWNDILDLRQSKYRKGFLSKLDEIAKTPANVMVQELKESLWRLATDARREASLSKAVWKGIAGNIPTGPILLNPLSLWWSAKSGRETYRRSKQYGWLFFLTELRDRMESDGDRPRRDAQ